MDEIALIRALAADKDKPEAHARAAARQALEHSINCPASASPTARLPVLRRGFFAVGAMALAVTAAVLLLAAGGSTHSTSPVYGAELVRFAQSTPLLLLEQPGWEVRNMGQAAARVGQIEFGSGPRISPIQHYSGHSIADSFPVSPRSVVLRWHSSNTPLRKLLSPPEDHGIATKMPVLDTTAYVTLSPRLSYKPDRGFRLAFAVWRQGHQVLEMATYVQSPDALLERLSWVRRVDAADWLDAMPQQVISGAEYGTEVSNMLKGIPFPPGFNPKQIPNLHLTTSRYLVGRAVGGAAACDWLGRWFEAHADGDQGAAREARNVLLRSGRWPVFRKISKEGTYPALVLKFAEALPSGRFGNHPSLLEIVDKNCAEIGSPIASHARTG